MRKKQIKILFIVTSMLAIGSTQAHPLSEHIKAGEKPKCEAMKNMDHSKMDMNDTVMQAMMKKCMTEQSGEGHSEESQVHDSSPEKS